MEILIFVAALSLGIIAGFLIGKRSSKQSQQPNAELEANIITLSTEKAALTKEIEMLQEQLKAERQRSTEELERQVGSLQEQFNIERQRAGEELKRQVDILQEQIETERKRSAEELSRQKEEFKAQQSSQEQHFKEIDAARREEFNQQLELVKSQLKQETEKSNRDSITDIMRPYREQLEQMKQQNIEDRASLQTEIKQFVETGGRLTREADRLVTALSGSVTIQGNLGEKLLRDILAGSGLQEDIQYKLQKTIRNEDGTASKNSSGNKMRPDAALLYPETDSVLYIDSKFQLPSELDFENLKAENQEVALKAFRSKIEEQAKKLASRDYDRSNDDGLTPLPYVIMFVPSEIALTAVTSFDRTLWQRLFTEYKVCLASERNLLVLIEMVRYMWQKQKTIKNHEEIISKASTVLDRVIDFMGSFEGVENALSTAVAEVQTMRRLSSSQGHSIAVAVRNLSDLGVQPSKTKDNKRQTQLKKMLKNANLDDIEEITEITETADIPEIAEIVS